MEIEWFPSDIELDLPSFIIITDFDPQGKAKFVDPGINHVNSLVEIYEQNTMA
jgi:hypothetical protein